MFTKDFFETPRTAAGGRYYRKYCETLVYKNNFIFNAYFGFFQDDIAGVIPDPKIFQKRPRSVLSSNGKAFLNLWFIPHYTEILSSYQNLDWEVGTKFHFLCVLA